MGTLAFSQIYRGFGFLSVTQGVPMTDLAFYAICGSFLLWAALLVWFLKQRAKRLDWADPDFAPPAFGNDVPHTYDGTEARPAGTMSYTDPTTHEKRTAPFPPVASYCKYCGGGRKHPVHRV